MKSGGSVLTHVLVVRVAATRLGRCWSRCTTTSTAPLSRAQSCACTPGPLAAQAFHGCDSSRFEQVRYITALGSWITDGSIDCRAWITVPRIPCPARCSAQRCRFLSQKRTWYSSYACILRLLVSKSTNTNSTGQPSVPWSFWSPLCIPFNHRPRHLCPGFAFAIQRAIQLAIQGAAAADSHRGEPPLFGRARDPLERGLSEPALL